MDFDSEEVLGDYELPASFLSFSILISPLNELFLPLFVEFVGESRWVYADFKPGDLLIFNIKTIHCSFRYSFPLNPQPPFKNQTETTASISG